MKASKTKQKMLKSQVREKFIAFAVRFPPDELEAAKKKAAEYAAGNLSSLIREAVKKWTPGPDDLA